MAQWENINSEGLDRWGHFTSSKRSMELHEPIYTNLWTAQILPSDLPNGMLAYGYGADDVKIVLEGLRSVGGLQTQRGTQPVNQKYKHVERGYAGSAPSQTHLDLAMNFELNVKRNDDGTNDNYTYKFLRRWSDLTFDPLTGRMHIKKNYAAKAITIMLHDKEGKPIHQWICYNLFPTSALPEPPLSYDNANIWQSFNVTFWCDYYDEAIL